MGRAITNVILDAGQVPDGKKTVETIKGRAAPVQPGYAFLLLPRRPRSLRPCRRRARRESHRRTGSGSEGPNDRRAAPRCRTDSRGRGGWCRCPKGHAVAHTGSQNEWIRVDVSVACEHHQVGPGGLALEPRERLVIWIPAGFPFHRPEVRTEHTRSPAIPMFSGVVISASIRRRQRNGIRAMGCTGSWSGSTPGWIAPPEMTLTRRRTSSSAGRLPDPRGSPKSGGCAGRHATDYRRAVDRVCPPPIFFGSAGGRHRLVRVGERHCLPTMRRRRSCSLRRLPFEFPSTVRALVDHLAARAIPQRPTPNRHDAGSRRERRGAAAPRLRRGPDAWHSGSWALRQHLAVWSIDPVIAKALRLAVRAYLVEDEAGQEIGDDVVRVSPRLGGGGQGRLVQRHGGSSGDRRAPRP